MWCPGGMKSWQSWQARTGEAIGLELVRVAVTEDPRASPQAMDAHFVFTPGELRDRPAPRCRSATPAYQSTPKARDAARGKRGHRSPPDRGSDRRSDRGERRSGQGA